MLEFGSEFITFYEEKQHDCKRSQQKFIDNIFVSFKSALDEISATSINNSCFFMTEDLIDYEKIF